MFYVLLFIVLYLLYKKKESFGWSCYFTPYHNYFEERWLEGGNDAALAMARDSIKGPIPN